MFIFALLIYVLKVWILWELAVKTGEKIFGFMALFPIADVYLMLRIGKVTGFAIVFYFVPILRDILITIIWCRIAYVRRKSFLLGLLTLIPFGVLLIGSYLAFFDNDEILIYGR